MSNLETISPVSLHAEQSVIGALLIDGDSIFEVTDTLKSNDFYYKEHQLIYSTMCKMKEQGSVIDIITIDDWLDVKKVKLELNRHLEKKGITALSYLMTLANNVATSANITAYAKIVRDKAMLRGLVSIGQDISQKAYSNEHTITELISDIEHKISSLQINGDEVKNEFNAIDLVDMALSHIERASSGDNARYLKTGFVDIDNTINGLKPEDFVVIAARPNIGKTTLALNIALNVAVKNPDLPVMFFSMETSAGQISQSILSYLSRVEHTAIQNGRNRDGTDLTDNQWFELTDASVKFQHTKFSVCDLTTLNNENIKSKLRSVKKKHGNVGLIVIDFIQLMETTGKTENRNLEIAKITRTLKKMAIELKTTIIAISAMNRESEKRSGDNKRPQMSDLREGGSIESDADCILALHQPIADDQTNLEIIVLKNRSGERGRIIPIGFDGKIKRFYSVKQD